METDSKAFTMSARGIECSRLSLDHEDSHTTTTRSASEDQEYLPRVERSQCCRKQNDSKRRLTDIIMSIIVTLIFTIAFQWLYHLTTFDREALFHAAVLSVYGEEARQTPLYHCGNSSAEARAQGCIFDISVVGWVPEPCFDQELNQRFLDWGWRFFEDQEGTREVSLERLAESAGTREPFWVQHGYHITHCELAWQRMHRAIMRGGRITTHLMNLEHTHHCGMMTEMRDDFQSINAQILPLLNTC